MKILALLKLSEAEQQNILSTHPAVELIMAPGYFDGEIRDTWPAFCCDNYLAPQASTITPAAENKGNFKAGGLFRTNAQSLESDITIAASENATATGTLSIASGVTLTIESGGRLVVL